MDTKHVVAAVIIHNGKVFATQRGYGEFKDRWEFPGGKIEKGETPEHESARWLDLPHLYDVNWLPADRALLEKVAKYL